jgi:hypothetical protein
VAIGDVCSPSLPEGVGSVLAVHAAAIERSAAKPTNCTLFMTILRVRKGFSNRVSRVFAPLTRPGDRRPTRNRKKTSKSARDAEFSAKAG